MTHILNRTSSTSSYLVVGIISAMLTAALNAGAAAGGDPEFISFRPSNTGIPGQENVLFAEFAPDGTLWVAARDGFVWQQGGVASFDGEAWVTYSNIETPLPQWNYDIDFAPDGSIWVAGDFRVNHFDGESWTPYDESNSPLEGDRNWEIAVAPNGHVWVANDDIDSSAGGLFEFDGTNWIKHAELVEGSFDQSANGIYTRSNGDIWADFDALGGHARFVDGEWIHQQGTISEFGTDVSILDFGEAPDGTLYGVNGIGTHVFDDETDTWNTIGPYTTSDIFVDHEGNVWVDDNFSLFKYDGESWVEFFSNTPSDIKDIEVRPNGDVWIALEHSVIQHDARGEVLNFYQSIGTGMTDYIIRSLFLDQGGKMWFTSSLVGATQWDGENEWRYFGGSSVNEVWPFGNFHVSPNQVFQDSSGDYWMVCNGAARSSDLVNWDVWHPNNSSLTAGADSIGEDANGTIWVCNKFVLHFFDGENWITDSARQGEQIVTDANGVMWVAFNGVLHRYDGEVWSTIFPGATIRDMAADPDGSLWLATGDGLLHLVDGVVAETFTPANSGLAELNVAAVAVREDGLVAATSEQLFNLPYDGGLALFDGETWTAYNYCESDLPFYQNLDLEFDADGHLWIGSVNFGAVKVTIGEEPQNIPGDLNNDGVVDGSDLGLLLGAFNSADADADLNNDGVVDGADLGLLLGNWS